MLTDSKGNKVNVQKIYGSAKNSAAKKASQKASHIVELREKPLAEAKAEIEKRILPDYKNGAGRNDIRERVKEELKSYSQRLKESREKAMAEIEKSAPQIKIINDYKEVFNGFSADIPEEKISEIKSLPSVKNIYTNDKVKIVLEESVNQINADEIWKLDKDGNDCENQTLAAQAILKIGGNDYKVISSSDTGLNDFSIKVDIDSSGLIGDFDFKTISR